MRPERLAVGLLVLGLVSLLAGCTGEDRSTGPQSTDTVRPGERALAPARAVAIETGSCGSADPSRGSGVALGPDEILTAAHVVASGGPIEVVAGDGKARPARLVRYDPKRDLAVVAPAHPLEAVPPSPTSGELDEGDGGTIVGASTSDELEATIVEATIIEIDDVRATTRSTRRGYLVEAATVPGDSGAGLYDADGRLVGLVFAVSTADAGRSWVTASSEIDAFLADESTLGSFGCHPATSRVARLG